MYPQFFGFDKLPFRLRPDPAFLFASPEYLHARAGVIAALRGSARVVLFMGPPGSGKTLLLEDVLRETGGQFATCRINQPHISATELLQAILIQLGTGAVPDADMNHARLFSEVTSNWDTAGAREAPPLLVIDDAQMLAAGTLLTLGDILVRAPRLKILLVGQSGQEPRGADLAARIAVAQKPRQVPISALSAASTRAYIEHRLKIAGAGGKELFTDDAFATIFQHTGGSARLINVLCDAALHAACLRASGHVSAAEIVAATQDARWPEAVAREKVRPAGAAVVDEPPDWDEEPAGAQVDAAPATNGYAAAPADAAAAVATEEPATTPHLYVTHRKAHVTALPIKTGRISIGRASDNVLRLDSPVISRHHCVVVTDGNVSTLEDLGSINGIVVNGKMVKRHVLRHADQIIVGEHVLTFVQN